MKENVHASCHGRQEPGEPLYLGLEDLCLSPPQLSVLSLRLMILYKSESLEFFSLSPFFPPLLPFLCSFLSLSTHPFLPLLSRCDDDLLWSSQLSYRVSL